MYKNQLIGIIVLVLAATKMNYGQIINYKPGNGLHITSINNDWDFLFSGYINTTYNYQNTKENDNINNSFYVHRERIDLGFNYLNKYDLFFEFDAAGKRTEMVLAQVRAKIFSSNYLLAGKFINPFSPENNRSTRSLTTIERYSGLNSLFLLPALDAQYGIMFYGINSNLGYYLSITNGNGTAAQNIKDNNNSKELTGRLEYKYSSNFGFGGSIDYTKEEEQKLSLLDHTFASFNTTNVYGERIGYLGNIWYERDRLLLRSEFFQYNFNDKLSSLNEIKKFAGGYFEIGYFLTGNKSKGVQVIGRFETAGYNETISNFSGPTVLNSYILGSNWYANDIFNLQLNLIYEKTNQKSELAGQHDGEDNSLLILTTIQIAF